MSNTFFKILGHSVVDAVETVSENKVPSTGLENFVNRLAVVPRFLSKEQYQSLESQKANTTSIEALVEYVNAESENSNNFPLAKGEEQMSTYGIFDDSIDQGWGLEGFVDIGVEESKDELYRPKDFESTIKAIDDIDERTSMLKKDHDKLEAWFNGLTDDQKDRVEDVVRGDWEHEEWFKNLTDDQRDELVHKHAKIHERLGDIADDRSAGEEAFDVESAVEAFKDIFGFEAKAEEVKALKKVFKETAQKSRLGHVGDATKFGHGLTKVEKSLEELGKKAYDAIKAAAKDPNSKEKFNDADRLLSSFAKEVKRFEKEDEREAKKIAHAALPRLKRIWEDCKDESKYLADMIQRNWKILASIAGVGAVAGGAAEVTRRRRR